MGAMQKLAGLMRRAIEKYDMIQPNDRIAVGVSGGKDSVALLVGLFISLLVMHQEERCIILEISLLLVHNPL